MDALRAQLAERDADAEVLLAQIDELSAQIAEREEQLAERDEQVCELVGRLAFEARMRKRPEALEDENSQLRATLAQAERSFLAELGALRELVMNLASKRAPASHDRAESMVVLGLLRRELRRSEELASSNAGSFAVATAALGAELAEAETTAVIAVMDAAEASLDAHEAEAAAEHLRARSAKGGALAELTDAYELLSEDRRLLLCETDELRLALAQQVAHGEQILAKARQMAADELAVERTQLAIERQRLEAERKAVAFRVEEADARVDAAERLAERRRVRAARGDGEVRPASPLEARAQEAAQQVLRANRMAERANTLSPKRERVGSPGGRATSPVAAPLQILGAPNLRTAAPSPTNGRRLVVEAGLRAQALWQTELAASGTSAGLAAAVQQGLPLGRYQERQEDALADAAYAAQAARTWIAAQRGGQACGAAAGSARSNDESRGTLFASPERKRWQEEVRRARLLERTPAASIVPHFLDACSTQCGAHSCPHATPAPSPRQSMHSSPRWRVAGRSIQPAAK